MDRLMACDLKFPDTQERVQQVYTHWVDDFVGTWVGKPGLRPTVDVALIERLLKDDDRSLPFVPNLHSGQMWPMFGRIAVQQKRYSVRFSTNAAHLICELSPNLGVLEMYVLAIKHIEVGCGADRLVTTNILATGYFNDGFPSMADLEKMWDAAKCSDGTVFFQQIDVRQIASGDKEGGG